MEELAEVKKDVAEIKADITGIKKNHLPSILEKIAGVKGEVRNLRWFIMGSVMVLGIVLAIIEVFG